jgi:septum formation protein
MLVLGSTSPRRVEILSYLGVPFKKVAPNFIEENILFSGDPRSYTLEIAIGKAESLSSLLLDVPILTADTCVFLENKVLGKPTTQSQAIEMLQFLSGKTHQVITSVCIAFRGEIYTETEITEVEIIPLCIENIEKYLSQIHPFDKAGSYAIQKGGSMIVKRIGGCYYNVMGLPIQPVKRLLSKVGIDLWQYFQSA